MRRVGVGAEKPEKKSTDAKLKKEKLQAENAALKEENEKLQPKE